MLLQLRNIILFLQGTGKLNVIKILVHFSPAPKRASYILNVFAQALLGFCRRPKFVNKAEISVENDGTLAFAPVYYFCSK